MTEKPLTLQDFSFEKTIVDPEQIVRFTSEDDLMSLAVELFKEVGKITAILACAYRLDMDNRPRKWTRNEAIQGGLFVRLTKLQIGMLDAVCQRRLEIAHILFRCLAETVINLKYMIQASSDVLYDEYVEYSLREEKRLLNLIDKNVKSRGYELPIESRMRRLIMREFDNSGIAPDQVDETKRTAWGKSIFKRAKSVGMADAYPAVFGLPSHVVHGSWQDLLQYHVEQDSTEFSPSPDWTIPRPQIVFAAALLSADACRFYLSTILPECEDRRALQGYIDDCVQRVREADEMHEQFLQKRSTIV